MFMRQSFALENLSSLVPPIDEDYIHVANLLHAPFKGSTLFGGELAKLQNLNMEQAKILTMFPHRAGPLTTYSELNNFSGRGEGAGDMINLLLLLL